jgi:hypothetical protein
MNGGGGIRTLEPPNRRLTVFETFAWRLENRLFMRFAMYAGSPWESRWEKRPRKRARHRAPSAPQLSARLTLLRHCGSAVHADADARGSSRASAWARGTETRARTRKRASDCLWCMAYCGETFKARLGGRSASPLRGKSLEVRPRRRRCDGETAQAKHDAKAARAIG